MSVITSIRDFFISKSPAQKSYMPTWQEYTDSAGRVHTTVMGNATSYSKNSLVVACIAQLGLSFQEAKLKVYNSDNEILRDNPLRQILKYPSPGISESHFWIIAMMHMSLSGNAYLHKVRDKNGFVIGVTPLNPLSVSIECDSFGFIDYYKYKAKGRTISIGTDDIIHLRWLAVDPTNFHLGYAPLLSVADEIGTDNEIRRMINVLLRNDAMMRAIVSFSDSSVKLSEERVEQLRAKVEQTFGGNNRGRVAFVEAGMNVSRLSANLQELQVEGLHNVPETRICAAFRIPPVIAGANVGTLRSTYANFSEAEKVFTTRTLVPLWNMVASAFTEAMIGEQIGMAGVEFNEALRFDTQYIAALKEDVDMLSNRVRSDYQTGIITRNEARQKLGYDAIDGQDRFIEEVQSVSMFPALPAVVDTVEPTLQPQPALPRFAKSSSVGLMVLTKDEGLDEAKATEHWKSYDRVMQQGTNNIASAIAEAVGEITDDLIDEIVKVASTQKSYKNKEDVVANLVLSFWDNAGFKDVLAEKCTDAVASEVDKAIRIVMANVGQDWDTVKGRYTTYVDQQINDNVARIQMSDDTIKQEIANIVRNNINKRPEELRKILEQKFETLASSRAEMIARTVSTRIVGALQDKIFADYGFDKVWITQRDGKVRESHRRVDGAKPNTDGLFRVGSDSMKHPCGGDLAEENVNCRCVLAPRRK